MGDNPKGGKNGSLGPLRGSLSNRKASGFPAIFVAFNFSLLSLFLLLTSTYCRLNDSGLLEF